MLKGKDDQFNSAPARSLSDGGPIPWRSSLSLSKPENPLQESTTQSGLKRKRRNSFTLSGLRSSLCSVDSDDVDDNDDDFYVKSVLWDNDDGVDGSVIMRSTVAF